jgi:hypothetical protein
LALRKAGTAEPGRHRCDHSSMDMKERIRAQSRRPNSSPAWGVASLVPVKTVLARNRRWRDHLCEHDGGGADSQASQGCMHQQVIHFVRFSHASGQMHHGVVATCIVRQGR